MFAPVYGSYSNIAGKQEEIEMFDKLEDLLIRLEEILSELQEPDVASDPNRFRKLMKEQSELTPIVEAYKEYKACKQNIKHNPHFGILYPDQCLTFLFDLIFYNSFIVHATHYTVKSCQILFHIYIAKSCIFHKL